MFDRCPGSMGLTTPTLKAKKCPQCGREVEVFSNDVQVKCENCGFTVYNDVESCIQWCKYARQCVGDDLYKKLKKIRVVFLGRENASRSIMAEALANQLNNHPNLVFLSAGVTPAGRFDPIAAEFLSRKDLKVAGKPKAIAKLGPVDVVVDMTRGLDYEASPGTRVVTWDIPQPREDGNEGYLMVHDLLKEKIPTLIKELSV
ncbi:MAG TPA: hypothetical protein VMW83_00930 [Spirochaetia bacterium]|nr:hypothetical protein [Spirochaetia bacterium]